MTSFSRTTIRSIGALVLVAALVGCGTSGTKSAATTRAKSTTTTDRSTTTVDTGSTTTEAGQSATTVARPSTSNSPNTTPSTVTARGGGKFCKQIADSYNSALAQSSQATTPAALRKVVEAGQKKSQAALDSAPDEIKPDLRTIYAASNGFIAALKKAGYDVTKVSPTASAGLSTPAIRAASSRLLVFVNKRCGIDLGGASRGTGSAPATTIP